MSISLTPPLPSLDFAFRIAVAVGAPIEGGPLPEGRRRIIPILGGTFSGPRLSGEVPAFGADWQIVERAALVHLTARYTLRTADGTLIGVTNRALRTGPGEVIERLARGETVDPRLYYFRGHIRFEAPLGPHRWLSERLFICAAARGPEQVFIDVYEVG
ncbi:MAG: DUF3237 domain-containing protein [Acidobacteriia bacterium]|nr:DUF3237 domain-containing protein [Methyloceanibacter sp.]MCL6492713.1 DUF3237 domain-containing protein [Terriglobia bacterium]